MGERSFEVRSYIADRYDGLREVAWRAFVLGSWFSLPGSFYKTRFMKTAQALINDSLPAAQIQKIRTLKIQPIIRVKRWEDDITVPEIRLCGAWLEKLGFNYGKKVEVRTSEGRLVITPVSDDRE